MGGRGGLEGALQKGLEWCYRKITEVGKDFIAGYYLDHCYFREVLYRYDEYFRFATEKKHGHGPWAIRVIRTIQTIRELGSLFFFLIRTIIL